MRVSRLRLRFRTYNKQSRSAPLPALTPRQRSRRLAEAIGYAFRDGLWVPPLMAARAAHDLHVERGMWLTMLAVRASYAFVESPDDRPRGFVDWIEAELIGLSRDEIDDAVYAWLHITQPQDGNEPWLGPPQLVVPAEMAERRWPVPVIGNVAELAEFLRLDPGELAWYADVKSLERHVTDENLRHYNYYWLPKQRGGARLVEAPKQNLKYLQRQVLREILNHIPPHDAAHGFRRGRSIQSYAGPHTARDVVVRLDLRDFFTTVPPRRVFGIFYTAGYPEHVAHVLAGLTTNATPAHVLRNRRGPLSQSNHLIDPLLRGPHLPQGGPCSPALANLACFGLDRRMSALAERFDARYTRYADDLAISGDAEFAESVDRFLHLADIIVRDEGFRINSDKTRRQPQSQRQVLTGMVVNKHLNTHRRDFDQLKAVLHDTRKNGPAIANRAGHPQFRAHLEGRISFVQATNPNRARKLWRSFDQIRWTTT